MIFPEFRGLVHSRPALRPADILTSVAFNVGVCCPKASGCRAQLLRCPCTVASRRFTLRTRAICSGKGVRYQLLIWSSYGRAHVDASAIFRGLACAVARCRGAVARCRGVFEWRMLLDGGACCHLVAQVRWCLFGDVVLEQVGSKGRERRRRVPEDEEAAAAAAAATAAAVPEAQFLDGQ